MKVLILTSAFPPTPGGAESYAHALAEGLIDRGADVVVLTDGRDGCTAKDPPYLMRMTKHIATLADRGRLVWEQMAFALLDEVETRLGVLWEPEVIVANNLETAIFGRMLALRWRVPLVGSFHEHEPELEAFGPEKLEFVYQIIGPEAVLAGSNMYAERALRYLPNHRVHLVHHGVNTNVFGPRPPLPRSDFGLQDDSLLIASVGRLKLRKGYLDLVEAVAKVRAAGCDTHLIIAGSTSSGPAEFEETLNDKVAKHNLTDRFSILGGLHQNEIADLLATADVVALPSHSEGFGLAMMEAMSCGRPVIATRIVGFAEVLAAGPPTPLPIRLVNPKAPDQLAAALLELLGNEPLRRELGYLARRHIVDHLSLTQMIRRTWDVLVDVIDQHTNTNKQGES